MRIRKFLDENNEETQFIAEISNALSHPVRAAILKYVSEKNNIRNDVCNNDLVQNFPYSQATISQHVKKMVAANLFIIEKVDKYSHYSINREVYERYVQLLRKI